MTLPEYLQTCLWKKLRAIQLALNARVYGKRSKSDDLRNAIVYFVQRGFVTPERIGQLGDAYEEGRIRSARD